MCTIFSLFSAKLLRLVLLHQELTKGEREKWLGYWQCSQTKWLQYIDDGGSGHVSEGQLILGKASGAVLHPSAQVDPFQRKPKRGWVQERTERD